MRLTIWVSGKPVPKGRPRFGRGRTYTPKTTRDYEARVSETAQEALQGAGIARTGGRVAVVVTALYGVPKSYRGKQRTDALLGMSYPSADADNVLKSALDGMNNVVYEDDRQVVQLGATKRWAREGEEEGLTIEVHYLDGQPG